MSRPSAVSDCCVFRRLSVSFVDPLDQRTRKYLDIKATTVVPASNGSQPPSRPTSSQSVQSTQSESRVTTHSSKPSSSTAKLSSSTSTTSQHPGKHVRTLSTSHNTAEAAPPRRPLRAPTPEVAPAASAAAHNNGPRRPVREEPRRLKVDMPPPDLIPAHTGPQRPMSAAELYFPQHAPSERPVSGPQRVLRPDMAPAGSSTTAMRTGPIRPFMFKPTSSEDGAGAEKKERVMGGARRVPRMPEPEPAPPAEDKVKAPTAVSKPPIPIRPRVISTSRSTPAIPLHLGAAVREDPVRVKKLASSVGASSKPAAAAAPARASRIATASTTQATASSRARTAEKTAAEKDERRIRTQSRDEREKEKIQARDQEKARERKPSTKMAAAAPAVASRHGPGPTVTMRDKTNRMHTKNSEKAAAKEAQKVPSKARSSPDVPEVVEVVAAAEVPLPETPKVVPVCVEEPSPPALICLDTPEKEVLAPVAAPSEPEQTAAPAPVSNPLSPVEVPLPSSRPSSADGTRTPPLVDLAPAPHIATPELRPRRVAEVEQTPISALVASIQRGFFSMHGGSALETMAEMDEEESMLIGDAGEADDGEEMFPPVPVVAPLFSRSVHA